MPQRSSAHTLRTGTAARPRLTALKYTQLFLPYVVAEVLAFAPAVSYLTAWCGSLGILYLTISGKIKPLPTDRSLARQFLRPIVFTQVVFISFTALTSIFYFAAQSGYYYLQFSPAAVAAPEQLALLAEAQRYYVLGHASVATGMLLAMNYRSSGRWQLNVNLSMPKLMLGIAAGALVGRYLLGFIPALSQLAGRFASISFIASILSLALSLPSRKFGLTALNLIIYSLNFFQALLSGWKSEVIIMLALLGLFAYPYYRRTVAVLMPVAFFLLLSFLPTYNTTFRSLNWKGDVEAERAASVAYETVQTADVQMLKRNTWSFLTGRVSLANMFTEYLRQTPEEHSFYGTQLAKQAAASIIPRALWPSKPSTERQAMQRVYDYDIVSRNVKVSAKTPFIVDSYLSAGAFGVFLFCLFYGFLASWASRLAERWFGGYLVGTGLMYMALFRIFWKGNTFEFFSNTVFWSFVIMYVLFVAGRYFGFLVPDSSRV
jgi:hypothetical protein